MPMHEAGAMWSAMSPSDKAACERHHNDGRDFVLPFDDMDADDVEGETPFGLGDRGKPSIIAEFTVLISRCFWARDRSCFLPRSVWEHRGGSWSLPQLSLGATGPDPCR